MVWIKFNKIIYDNNTPYSRFSSPSFAKCVVNHRHLYFIVIDSDNNVFGHYHNGLINDANVELYDNKIFMFTLNSIVI